MGYLISLSGDEILSKHGSIEYVPSCGRVKFQSHDTNKYGFIDLNDEIAVDPIYDHVKSYDPSSGTTIATTSDDNTYLLDMYGNRLCGPFSDIGRCRNGMIRFKEADKGDDAKYGFLSADYQVAIPPRFLVAEDFSCGLASTEEIVNEEIGMYYIDTRGNRKLGPYHYTRSRASFSGLGVAVHNERRMLAFQNYADLIDTRGNVLRRFRDMTVSDFKHHVTPCSLYDSGSTYINIYGERITDMVFEEAGCFYRGYAIARLGDEYVILDLNGDTIGPVMKDIAPLAFDGYIGMFLDLKANRWYFKDVDGRLLFNRTFASTEFFNEGYACVND